MAEPYVGTVEGLARLAKIASTMSGMVAVAVGRPRDGEPGTYTVTLRDEHQALWYQTWTRRPGGWGHSELGQGMLPCGLGENGRISA